MSAKRPEVDTEEFIQSRLERHVREQYELHGWATAISVANPLEILIMLEEEADEEIEPQIHIKQLILKGTIK